MKILKLEPYKEPEHKWSQFVHDIIDVPLTSPVGLIYTMDEIVAALNCKIAVPND